MKKKRKTGLKKLIYLTLATILVFSKTSVLLAADSEADTIDFELLADGISAKEKLDAEYKKIGIDFNQLLTLPEREDFKLAGEAYLEDFKSKASATSRAATENRTLKADRLAYAGKMANWSLPNNSPKAVVDREMVYMYLSHYVDVQEPLSEMHGISNNSEKSNIWAKYITNYDRETYAQYIGKGSAGKSFKAISTATTMLVNAKATAGTTVSALQAMQSYAMPAIAELVELGFTHMDGEEIFIAYQNAYQDGMSVEYIIDMIETQLKSKPDFDDPAETAKRIAALLFAPNPIGIHALMFDLYMELGSSLIDRANYVGMRSYYNFRMYDRMDYFYLVG